MITLLSDFGSASPYPAEMKLALAALTDAVLLDITHDVPPHDVRTVDVRELTSAVVCSP